MGDGLVEPRDQGRGRNQQGQLVEQGRLLGQIAVGVDVDRGGHGGDRLAHRRLPKRQRLGERALSGARPQAAGGSVHQSWVCRSFGSRNRFSTKPIAASTAWSMSMSLVSRSKASYAWTRGAVSRLQSRSA